MKFLCPIYFLLLGVLMSTSPLLAQSEATNKIINKVIYGDDNRREMSELDEVFDQDILQYSKAVMAQIPMWRVSRSDDLNMYIKTRDFKTALNICSEERFSDQPVTSSCTAFLVGPDLIMTAGHCVKDKFDCKKNHWVIDYDSKNDFLGPTGEISFSKSQTYTCKELVTQRENSKLDYALIRLDRKIDDDRSPLKLRESGKVPRHENLFVIGHPLGLPKIVADNVLIRDNSMKFFFKTNSDTYSGNSGSPVIGTNSGLVEGILIRGEDDFEMDLESSCKRSTRCQNLDCAGEVVLRSGEIDLKNLLN